MRLSISIAILFVAGRTAAQPADPPEVAEPGPCEVSIVRAPPEVRLEIETWVRREPSCRIALEVRVIPTEGGLYLLARESTGRLHERLVPDARDAGVLVASWAANDTLGPPSPPRVPAAAAAQSAEVEIPPNPVTERALVTRAPLDGPRWAFGVMVLPNATSGARLRGTLDIAHRGGLAAELIFAGGHSAYELELMQFQRIDLRALLGLSWTSRRGPWQVRLQAAAGAVWSHVFRIGDTPPGNWRAFPLEASIALGYHVSDAWAVSIAPVGTLYRTSQAETNAALPGNDLGVLLELRRGP